MSRWPESRVNVRFSADGSCAACLAVGRSDQVYLERWELTGAGPRRQFRVPLGSSDPVRSTVLPVSGSRVLAVIWRDGRRRLVLYDRAGALRSRPAPWPDRVSLWMMPDLSGGGLALGVAGDPERDTGIYRVTADLEPPGGTLLARVRPKLIPPGFAAGGQLFFHTRLDGEPPRPGLLDPATGELAAVVLPDDVDGAVPVAAAGGAVLLAVSIGGQRRLVVASPARPGEVDPLPGLDALDGAVRPLALDPAGDELLLQVRTGIRCRLLRYARRTGRIGAIGAPLGTALPVAASAGHGSWLLYTTTTTAPALWWLPAGGSRLRPAAGLAPAGEVPGRVEELPGPAGPIEAVVYGDWRTGDRVVVALHGGPAERWSLAYHPMLQALASAGLCVVAPNQRGSTGYGREYEEAIAGAWGGPDLADILAIGAHLARVRGERRARPALYGTSYGAFLALLATAAEPPLWSGCVAVAPFLSGRRLYPHTGPLVRNLLDRLDGTTVYTDRLGPRDLLQLAPRIRGPVLLLHGERDTTVPVDHSRALVAALAAQPEAVVTYRELAGRAHDPLVPTLDCPEFAEVVRFIRGVAPEAVPAVSRPASSRHPVPYARMELTLEGGET